MEAEKHTYKSSGSQSECCSQEPCLFLPPCDKKTSFLQENVEMTFTDKTMKNFINLDKIKKMEAAHQDLHDMLRAHNKNYD